MSALDKLLGRAPADTEEATPNNALMGMVSKLIPPALVEQLGAQVAGVIQHFKDQQDILISQNILIINNQKAIMAKLGIENDGRSNGDDTNAGTDAPG